MKEAFEIMADHWAVTLFLGIIFLSCVNIIGEVLGSFKKK